MRGNDIIARTLTGLGVDRVYFIMGGPMVGLENTCEAAGMRMIDVRHEQAAAMMALADTRIRRAPNVCMAASGPGVMNLVTGVAHAWADAAPLVVIGGSSAQRDDGKGAFQEMDSVGVFRPITKLSVRCADAASIPEVLHSAWRTALEGKPGPVYVDMPGDVLYGECDETTVRWVDEAVVSPRPAADEQALDLAIGLLEAATRPILIAGSGVVWSGAETALNEFVQKWQIPFWTTPQAKGIVPESSDVSFPAARSLGFRDCDLIIQVGTRQNYVFNHFLPPRFNADAKLLQIDIDPAEIGRNRDADVALVGDARTVIGQLLDHPGVVADYSGWLGKLREHDRGRRTGGSAQADGQPIHPVTLCNEVAKWLPADAVVVADGQEILGYARQTFLLDSPSWLSSGTFGTMGVGLPFGIGAKFAAPDRTVVVMHGDGSFGFNAMEMDTALRHDAPVICVISNNGGWTATDVYKAGRDLGFTRYDKMFDGIGCFTAFVEHASDIIPALEAAAASGRPAVINVITDSAARAATASFTEYVT